jgi:2-keto-myo-inositol isomerase
MLDKSRFSLNRIIYPTLNLEDFFKLTTELGLSKVELRNDLPGGKILDNFSAKEVTALAERYGIQIITINAIQHFNLGALLEQVYANVKDMLHTASVIGCGAVVLCPNNDVEDRRTQEQFYVDTVVALKKLAPLFDESGITGLVEPLGFEESSLRSKEMAVKAIQESGYDGYKLVHDTFHHYLSPNEQLYPAYTGLVHISGVESDLPRTRIRDEHRILIGSQDIMRNKEQISLLEARGYTGFYSFEPFSADVQQMSLDALHDSIQDSITFLMG